MLRRLWVLLRTRLQRRNVKSEMDDELRFHLEKQVARNTGRGMAPAEARRRAMAELGGIRQIKEECRDAHSLADKLTPAVRS
jgi:putative ABC transport system permease protein